MDNIQPEAGSASIFIDLQDSTITVTHGTAGVVLLEVKNVPQGSWDAIWDTLKAIKSIDQG